MEARTGEESPGVSKEDQHLKETLMQCEWTKSKVNQKRLHNAAHFKAALSDKD